MDSLINQILHLVLFNAGNQARVTVNWKNLSPVTVKGNYCTNNLPKKKKKIVKLPDTTTFVQQLIHLLELIWPIQFLFSVPSVNRM